MQKTPKEAGLTRQQMFDIMVRHLRKQRACFSNNKGMCLYLDANGRKCAVGALIPNGHPAQRSLGDVDNLILNHRKLFKAKDAGFLYTCQRELHDKFANLEEWSPIKFEVAAIRVAPLYGLKVPE